MLKDIDNIFYAIRNIAYIYIDTVRDRKKMMFPAGIYIAPIKENYSRGLIEKAYKFFMYVRDNPFNQDIPNYVAGCKDIEYNYFMLLGYDYISEIRGDSIIKNSFYMEDFLFDD